MENVNVLIEMNKEDLHAIMKNNKGEESMPNLASCPFCGSKVFSKKGFAGILFFKCTNMETCGATISFNTEYLNTNPNEAVKVYNTRRGTK